MSRRLCSGNRMVAEGALAAGCRFAVPLAQSVPHWQVLPFAMRRIRFFQKPRGKRRSPGFPVNDVQRLARLGESVRN